MHEIINQFKKDDPEFVSRVTKNLELNKEAMTKDVVWNELEKLINEDQELQELRPTLIKIEKTIFDFIFCLAKMESIIRQGINEENSQEFEANITRQSDIHQEIIDSLAELSAGLAKHNLSIAWLERIFGKSLTEVATEYGNISAKHEHYLSVDRAAFRQLALTTAYQILSNPQSESSQRAA